MPKLLCLFFLATVIVSVLVACTSSDPTSVSSPLITPTDTQSSFSSPQPTPLYTPRPGVIAVQGVLTLMNPIITAPREDGIYLVAIDTNGEEGVTLVVPAVDPETDSQANVDEVTGQFIFAEVPPGLYALVAVTDSGQQLSVRKFETGEAVLVTLKQEDLGSVVDLGELRLP